mmetsp:Transcript_10133/g.21871  ORF Transcript_10133/g.21871 Transcript_10133/m.21871 type:complete len:361 (-) Transcript_10133:120-1202(-)
MITPPHVRRPRHVQHPPLMPRQSHRFHPRATGVVVPMDRHPPRRKSNHQRGRFKAGGAPRQGSHSHIFVLRDVPGMGAVGVVIGGDAVVCSRALGGAVLVLLPLLDDPVQLPMIQVHGIQRLVDPDASVGRSRSETESEMTGREGDGGDGATGVREGGLVDPPGGGGGRGGRGSGGIAGRGRLSPAAAAAVARRNLQEQSVGAPLRSGQALEKSPLAFLPNDHRVIAPRRGEQLAEFGVRPGQAVDGPLVGLPFVGDGSFGGGGVVAGGGGVDRPTHPRPVRIQIPHPHGPISAGGGEAAAVVVEGHVEDVVEVVVGEALRGGVEFELFELQGGLAIAVVVVVVVVVVVGGGGGGHGAVW